MIQTKPQDLITLTEARHILQISQAKIARLVREEVLRHWTTPLDIRVKLVSKSAVEELKRTRKAA